jgi:hypothetical protein
MSSLRLSHALVALLGALWLRGTLWFQPFRIDGFEALYYGKVADGD